MRAASVYCDGVGRGSHRGTASPPCKTARPRGRGRVKSEERSGRKGGASGHGVATAQSSKASLAWARGRNDNYDGGNDNYPSAVVETGARDERKDVARTGRSSCR